MKASVILSYFVILCQFQDILCVEIDRDCRTIKRTKRYHENECQKRTLVEKKPIKTTTPIGSKHIELKAKTVQKSANKSKVHINERNEPKDERTINHILEEIATLAHNHNETKGINKIKHLVDEIDNLDKVKTRVESNCVKSPKKEYLVDKKETKAEKINELTHERKTIIKKDPVNKTTNSTLINNKDSISINVKKSLLTNEAKHGDETITTKIPNETHIEIEEHKYDEELRSPYNYNTCNVYRAPNYNSGSIPYAYNGNGNYIENYHSNSNIYPLDTYEPYNGNNRYSYTNSPSPPNQPTCEYNGDYMRYRKTWLDRNTIISTRTPNEQLSRNVNEGRKELTNIQNPDYYRKYYSVTQKHYSSNNDVQKNQYEYYFNPYQCRK